MNKLEETLKVIDSKTASRGNGHKRPAIMTHVVLGYPTLKESISIVRAMADSGASIIELQIPFSDPMADGPTIMRANEKALETGVTPKDCMKAMEQLSKKVDIPLLFMSYFNLVFCYGSGKSAGVEKFCKDSKNAGASGLIIPDVPPEENSEGYWSTPQRYGLIPIPLVSPVSSNERIKKIARCSSGGFVYCVSTTGTTGARKSLPPGLKQYLANVRKHFKLPLAVGFGISDQKHITALAPYADIAIVGSAMIDLIGKTKKQQRIASVSKFTSQLAGH